MIEALKETWALLTSSKEVSRSETPLMLVEPQNCSIKMMLVLNVIYLLLLEQSLQILHLGLKIILMIVEN